MINKNCVGLSFLLICYPYLSYASLRRMHVFIKPTTSTTEQDEILVSPILQSHLIMSHQVKKLQDKEEERRRSSMQVIIRPVQIEMNRLVVEEEQPLPFIPVQAQAELLPVGASQANIEVVNGFWDTPLLKEIAAGNSELLKALSRRQLIQAIDTKNLENACQILDNNPEIIHAQSKDYLTPLHLAVDTGQADMVDLLLNRNANINVQDNTGLTPLHLAVHKGQADMVDLLLNSGANINAQSKDNLTPLHLAVDTGHADMVNLLLNRSANIEAQNDIGLTPLHLVVYKGQVDMVNLLLNHSANIEAQSKNNFTPLHLAVDTGQDGMVDLLLSRGANIKAQSNNNLTPLHLAVNTGQNDMIYKLLHHGALDFTDPIERERVINLAHPEFKVELTQLITDVEEEIKNEYVFK